LIAAGDKTYRMFCVACHQPDGRGIQGGAANFVDDKTRLAKPDAELLAVIENGNEAKAMPAFGAILSPGQRRAVLAYIRDAFGAKAQ
jgi:mono/diheme cytochrome c family protein